MTNDTNDVLVDLGDAVLDTKGSQIGVADLGAGQRSPFGGLSADD